MINSVYFGKEGLTSTSANFIANKAKEYCYDLEQSLKSVEFYKTSINLIGDPNASVLNYGTTDIDWIPEAIDTISKCNSLIAWLREAIKARENALNTIKSISIEEYAKFKGMELPEYPEQEDFLTENEYYNSLPIKERNRYYSLEAQAAAIGKFIHPSGSLNEARKKLSKKIQKPTEISGNGRDAVIYNYQSTVDPKDVDKMFFELQNKHREIQSQLNAMKFECEKAIKASAIKVNQEYQDVYNKYCEKKQQIRNDMLLYIEEQTKFISDLKIIIPDKLKGIYDEITKLGK